RSPRICTRYVCCVASACCSKRTAARMVSRSAARAASLLARSACSAWTWSSTFRTSPFRAQPAASPSARTAVLRMAEIVTAGGDFEFVTPVLRPRRLVMAVDQRFLLAPRLRLDPARIDAVAHEVLLGGLRPAIAESQVVLVRAALVAVTADADPQLRVRLQNRHLLIERAHIVRADVRLVIVEMDHRCQRVAHLFRRVTERGDRIGLPLARGALRCLTLLPFTFGLCRGDGIAHPLALGRGVDRRRRILRCWITAAGRGRAHGS